MPGFCSDIREVKYLVTCIVKGDLMTNTQLFILIGKMKWWTTVFVFIENMEHTWLLRIIDM